jgi:hypothetical protein
MRYAGFRFSAMRIIRYAVLNIPAFVLMIMIACCAIADVTVCRKPRMLTTAVPITYVLYLYLKKYSGSGDAGKPHV